MKHTFIGLRKIMQQKCPIYGTLQNVIFLYFLLGMYLKQNLSLNYHSIIKIIIIIGKKILR